MGGASIEKSMMSHKFLTFTTEYRSSSYIQFYN
uniref:Macaca fascicularis brain cDNA, clone: QflA-23192 n=1 Tax=Macaca fascicularis TaxID=9541 RepID=I7GP03_MACFA|nr:unnamed protein product [Macaca fascicularis]